MVAAGRVKRRFVVTPSFHGSEWFAWDRRWSSVTDTPGSNVDQWFLTVEERDNAASGIDRRGGDGRGWTDGNAVTVLVHGASYFRRLYEELSTVGPGDRAWFFDWRGDSDERLAGPGTELGS